ncbi:BREX-1 system adenine-specific DNA-methyltransferase PglX [Sphingobium indicum]|uniref:site-specific DNA-methyltransferase (adenine-specific) n=1 Tax=Sphingobium indicum (strain DSM 16412 / CCM 7286 / MTCC 6364 / B90A) TaxID=861109 RepID=A0A1L5BL67_SPHIB|nr:BREX-1 system adenine-specific DNA-methyltransferase PglX [Sphingobium indicum]APL93650.1 type II restriction endonuclease [Sphingobium indicum B90A]
MDTSKLKKFAQFARRALITQVSSKLESVVAENSAARREHPDAMRKLESAIAKDGKDQVVERVAYTWFNRFSALRFMDVNELNPVRVVSPTTGQFQPEILAEAKAGHMDEDRVPDRIRDKVRSLLDGRTPSTDAQTEAYRFLIVAICNDLHKAMPFLFERIDDYTELLLPDDLLSNASILAYVREAMTPDVCEDVEVIGWLYQFYISEKKDEVFAGLKKNKKITAENIPAATQLFTPHWIVRYLVENSLGRLWLLNRPNSNLAAQMDYYIAPEEPETDFLRISRPEDIRICDPACGSGHMLTYAFDLLYAIYEEEGYEATDIPGLILTNNLYGIEIDDRAGALAAFALAMKAATKLGRRKFLRQAVQPNICVLQDVRFTASEMQDVAAVVGSDLFTADFRETMGQFEQAKNFGSLIVPKLRDPAEVARVVRLKDFGGDLLLREVKERVLKVLEMAEVLSPKYHVVVANPPYMGASNMNGVLKDWTAKAFKRSKADLYAMFIDRNRDLIRKGGYFGMITMHGWMFISTYSKLREFIVKSNTLVSMAHLGTRGFDSIGGEVVSTTAFVQRNVRPKQDLGTYVRLTDAPSERAKAELFRSAKKSLNNGPRFEARTSDFEKIPGSPIAYWLPETARKLFKEGDAFGDFLDARIGLATGRNDYYLRFHYEVSTKNVAFSCGDRSEAKATGKKWFPFNKGGSLRKWYGNCEFVVNWENDGHELQTTMHPSGERIWAHNFNLDYIFKPMVSWSDITTEGLAVRFYPKGFIFDSTGVSAFEKGSGQSQKCIGAICNTKLGTYFSEVLNPTHHFTPGDFSRFPVPRGLVDSSHDENVARATSIAKSDWDAYETSWDFATLPLLSPDHRAGTLEGSYARLRAHWRGMTDEMQRLEEDNNRIFIDAYGLQDELTPEVPIEEITLICNPAYRYGVKGSEDDRETRLRADSIAEFLSYAVGCMFGRYSLDAPGLILANQGEALADYLARVPVPTFEPDVDNVIPVLDGDWFADDIAERFRKFLRVTFGEPKFQENLAFIEGALGKDIRKWFTKDFFDYHVRRFKKRPIYWMFTSPKGSFQALIYMHRYRPDTVSVVLNDYLREYRNKLEAHRKAQEAQSINPEVTPGQRTKALKEVGEATKVIEELDGYERDVLYPLATQKIEIDLDDGVKANYPKFGAALKPIKGLSDADD